MGSSHVIKGCFWPGVRWTDSSSRGYGCYDCDKGAGAPWRNAQSHLSVSGREDSVVCLTARLARSPVRGSFVSRAKEMKEEQGNISTGRM